MQAVVIEIFTVIPTICRNALLCDIFVGYLLSEGYQCQTVERGRKTVFVCEKIYQTDASTVYSHMDHRLCNVTAAFFCRGFRLLVYFAGNQRIMYLFGKYFQTRVNAHIPPSSAITFQPLRFLAFVISRTFVRIVLFSTINNIINCWNTYRVYKLLLSYRTIQNN